MHELILAIVTALGSLLGIIMFVMKRRDKRREEVQKSAEEAKDMYHEGVKNHDDRVIKRALDRLRRLRK